MYMVICYVLICSVVLCVCVVFFFKQKTAYEMRISDWSSDVCSSDLNAGLADRLRQGCGALRGRCRQDIVLRRRDRAVSDRRPRLRYGVASGPDGGKAARDESGHADRWCGESWSRGGKRNAGHDEGRGWSRGTGDRQSGGAGKRGGGRG